MSLCSVVYHHYMFIYVPLISCILFSVSWSGLVDICVCLLPSYYGLPLCGLLKTFIIILHCHASLPHHNVTDRLNSKMWIFVFYISTLSSSRQQYTTQKTIRLLWFVLFILAIYLINILGLLQVKLNRQIMVSFII